MATRTIVIGGGIGGLATSIRLAQAGHSVIVLEKNATLGGRCNCLELEGFRFDTGPTLLLMRDVLEELFASTGRTMDDYLDLTRLDLNYRIRFGDGSVLDVTADHGRMSESLELLQHGGSKGLERYLQDAKYKYYVSRARFVERNFCKLRDFVTLQNLWYLLTTNTLRSLEDHAGRYFSDHRLRAALTFQTMYLGLSPKAAPAVYSLLPYTELEEGIWFPRGGMYQIVRKLTELARDVGVEIHTQAQVDQIVVDDGRATGVRVGREVVGADVIVSNADLCYTYEHLLPEGSAGGLLSRRLPHLNQGSSAYLLFIGAAHSYPGTAHHTVFLSSNIDENYRAVFDDHRLPHDPSMYICIANRTDTTLSPAGRDGLYVLVPVPHTTPHIDWRRDEPSFRRRVMKRLDSLGFQDIESATFVRSCTPDQLGNDYNLTGGSAFGLSHNFWQVGYMRPSNKSPRIPNMYFVGASTVPGGGVPMVIIGSRLTAQRILGDRADA